MKRSAKDNAPPSWALQEPEGERAGRLETLALALLVLLWGWQADQLLAGIALCAFLALGIGFDAGFSFSRQAVRRAGFLCFFLGVGIAFWTFADKADFPDGMFWSVVERLPLIWAPRLLLRSWGRCAPPPLAQSGNGTLLARVASDAERLGSRATYERLVGQGLDAPSAGGSRAGFWGAFLVAMSMGAAAASDALGGSLACLGFGLWLAARSVDQLKSRSGAGAASPMWPQAALLGSIFAFCAFAAVGLQGAERLADRAAWNAANWRNQSSASWSTNLFRASIGRTGSLSLPGTLLWRVKTASDVGQHFYLRMAQFNTTYEGVNWAPLDPRAGPGGGAGNFSEKNGLLYLPHAEPALPGQSRARFELTGSVSRTNDPIPLPEGSFSLGGFTSDQLNLSPLSSLSAKENLGFVQYYAEAQPKAVFAPPPGAADLQVPPMLQNLLDKKAQELNLGLQGAVDAHILQSYFSKYKYTLQMGDGGRTLAEFLTTKREGHCEYFASATVLLLRQAGVPARLVSGFSVHEYDAHEEQWWVRSRDAHAWAIYWDGQDWRDLDTTPTDASEGVPGPSDAIFDAFARVQYTLQTLDLSNWAKAASISDEQKNWLLGALIGLFALGLDSLFERRRRSRASDTRAQSEQERQSRALLRRMEQASRLAWTPSEPLSSFARRAEAVCGMPSGAWSSPASAREAHLFCNAPFSPELTGRLKRASRSALFARWRRRAAAFWARAGLARAS